MKVIIDFTQTHKQKSVNWIILLLCRHLFHSVVAKLWYLKHILIQLYSFFMLSTFLCVFKPCWSIGNPKYFPNFMNTTTHIFLVLKSYLQFQISPELTLTLSYNYLDHDVSLIHQRWIYIPPDVTQYTV